MTWIPLGTPMGVQPIDEFPGFSFLLGDMHPTCWPCPLCCWRWPLALNGPAR
jgi:hypothetical protein